MESAGEMEATTSPILLPSFPLNWCIIIQVNVCYILSIFRVPALKSMKISITLLNEHIRNLRIFSIYFLIIKMQRKIALTGSISIF